MATVVSRHSKLPKVDLKELKRLKEENFRERLRFIDMYADWVRRNKSGTWSVQQKKLIG